MKKLMMTVVAGLAMTLCAELAAALKPWPNAVSVTGHIHRSIADDRNVWQGTFTAISAGCLHEASGGTDYRNVNYYWHKPSQKKALRVRCCRK